MNRDGEHRVQLGRVVKVQETALRRFMYHVEIQQQYTLEYFHALVLIQRENKLATRSIVNVAAAFLSAV